LKGEIIPKGGLFDARKRNNYMNCLLAPELFIARVPFIIGLPTALCRIRSIYTFSPTTTAPVFVFSFNPNGILCSNISDNVPDAQPFKYGTSASTQGTVTPASHLTNNQLFPQLHGGVGESQILSRMTNARVVGSSVQMSLTNAVIGRAGEMNIARTYQDRVQTSDRVVNFNAIRQAQFKDNAIQPNNYVRMTSAPMDFKDVNMKGIFNITNQAEYETVFADNSTVTGFITNWGIDGENTSDLYKPVVKMEFNVCLEYCPTAEMLSLVHVATSYGDNRALEHGMNSANDTGIFSNITKMIEGITGQNPMS